MKTQFPVFLTGLPTVLEDKNIAAVARRSKIGRSTLDNLVNRRRGSSLACAILLSHALGKPIEEIIGADEIRRIINEGASTGHSAQPRE